MIDFVVIFNEIKDKYNGYPYKLPFKLNIGHKNQDVVKKFGDTKDKGGGTIPIWVRYEHKGLEFQF